MGCAHHSGIMTNNTTGQTVTSPADLIDTHLRAYGEPDPSIRMPLLQQIWHREGQLIDPPLAATGVQGISDLADTLQGLYPRHRFIRTTEIDTHHDIARYGWSLLAPDGTVAVSGVDIADIAQGQIARIVGFFGDLLPAE